MRWRRNQWISWTSVPFGNSLTEKKVGRFIFVINTDCCLEAVITSHKSLIRRSPWLSFEALFVRHEYAIYEVFFFCQSSTAVLIVFANSLSKIAARWDLTTNNLSWSVFAICWDVPIVFGMESKWRSWTQCSSLIGKHCGVAIGMEREESKLFSTSNESAQPSNFINFFSQHAMCTATLHKLSEGWLRTLQIKSK